MHQRALAFAIVLAGGGALLVSGLGVAPASAAPGSVTFIEDGAFTVPPGVTCLDFSIVGGRGGQGSFAPPDGGGLAGWGAHVEGLLPVTPGEVIDVRLGARGSNGNNNNVDNPVGEGGGGAIGWANGGNGGSITSTSESSVSGGGGGGAASALLREATPVVVAGGGGGGGGGAQPQPAGDGGDSGLTGLDGADSPGGAVGGTGGGAAGPVGESANGLTTSSNGHGGGGGGGGFGNGGGAGASIESTTVGAGGGGGGDSFVDGTVEAETFTTGEDLEEPDGTVTLSWDPATNACGTVVTTPPTTAPPSTTTVPPQVEQASIPATPVAATPTFTG